MYDNMPIKRGQRLSVAIPASLVSDIPHLREKTFRIGIVGRAAAIFRVDEVIIYPDIRADEQKRDAELIGLILSFMETPQYLRKRLFKIRPELKYAGILPPLRTPHHPLQSRASALNVGEYRDGVVVSTDEKGSHIDVGVEKLAYVPNVHLTPNRRVTVKIIEAGKMLIARIVNTDEIQVYWGYKITISNFRLGQLLKERKFDLVIATSKYGDPIARVSDELSRRWIQSRNILLAFGSPNEGLHNIIMREGIKLEDLADFIINTIPRQATETVRTEEALISTLAILNYLRDH
ncbi:MAG: RNA methyltransferase [Nitrososphaerota archaeon]|nr:RNA methyltransferase [Candidatus Bathyarchaeota archaeon]MDW8049359.1 RNA methyltransferase [Nitrososphaerota archaeon]